MAFQDEACRWWNRVHLGKVKAPVLVGAVCVAALVVIVIGVGVAQALTTEGFVVTKSEETTAVASDAAAPIVEEEPLAQVCVYVSGEVMRPNIYYLEEGSRVADAITAAGGFTGEAATDALNLARTLIDGEQVAVPPQANAQAMRDAAVQSGGNAVGASVNSVTASGSAAIGGRVNINTADAATLQTLNGVGEATAKKIVADREANGPYKTIEDLKRVPGIGDKKFENLRDSICV